MASFPIYHPDANWKIYYKMYENGVFHRSGVSWTSYKHKSSAVRAAKLIFDEPRIYSDSIVTYEWTVSKTKPEET